MLTLRSVAMSTFVGKVQLPSPVWNPVYPLQNLKWNIEFQMLYFPWVYPVFVDYFSTLLTWEIRVEYKENIHLIRCFHTWARSLRWHKSIYEECSFFFSFCVYKHFHNKLYWVNRLFQMNGLISFSFTFKYKLAFLL